jgi:hypothetical protein
MHMSNSQAGTCHSEHGRITGAVSGSRFLIDGIAEDISTIQSRMYLRRYNV